MEQFRHQATHPLEDPDQILHWRLEIDRRCDSFEKRWKSNEIPEIESFLDEFPEYLKHQLVRELVELDLAYRRERGEEPVAGVYTTRFPQYAEMLREMVWKSKRSVELCVPPIPGEQIGEFQIDAELGRGATGIVFRARGVRDGAPVALKVSRFDAGGNWKLNARFAREAEILAAIEHPNIVRHVAHGIHGRRQYLATELLAGPTLHSVLKGSRGLPVAITLALAMQVTRAVGWLHERFILHRDLQASNVMFADDQTVRLIDFGLALPLVGDGQLSSLNRVIGPAECLPPEAAALARSEIGPESDLFALGGLLYHMLCGRPPFPLAEMSTHPEQIRPVVPLGDRNVNVARDLAAVVMRCLAPLPPQRYSSGEDLWNDLQSISRGIPLTGFSYTPWERLVLATRRWFQAVRPPSPVLGK